MAQRVDHPTITWLEELVAVALAQTLPDAM